MKKIAFLSILLGGVMLIGCSKPSSKAIPPTGTLPPVSAPVSASPGGPTPSTSTTNPNAAVPTVKDGPQPIAELPATQSQSAID